MSNHYSRILGPKACRTLERVAELIVPAVDDFPSFTQLGCVEHVDDVIGSAPPKDAADLNLFLTVLYFAPTSVLRFVVRNMENADSWFEPAATTFRLLDLGLRGLVLSLYYSGKHGANYKGKTPAEVIGFSLNRVPRQTVSTIEAK
ncbi:MAG: hypothetical protein WC655_09265 [Candidatus Hydrogenedentales bacterium]|jgi:hypothetical protein